MSNFERNIPIFIGNVEEKILELSKNKYSLDWGHECDCEFCDRDQGVPDETEEEASKIEAEIKDLHLLKKRLLAHAELHKIVIPTPTKGKK